VCGAAILVAMDDSSLALVTFTTACALVTFGSGDLGGADSADEEAKDAGVSEAVAVASPFVTSSPVFPTTTAAPAAAGVSKGKRSGEQRLLVPASGTSLATGAGRGHQALADVRMPSALLLFWFPPFKLVLLFWLLLPLRLNLPLLWLLRLPFVLLLLRPTLRELVKAPRYLDGEQHDALRISRVALPFIWPGDASKAFFACRRRNKEANSLPAPRARGLCVA